MAYQEHQEVQVHQVLRVQMALQVCQELQVQVEHQVQTALMVHPQHIILNLIREVVMWFIQVVVFQK